MHCDTADLSLAALGEPLSETDRDHLAACATCRTEFDALRSVVETVRAPLGGDAQDVSATAPVAPPASVWAGIAAATGVNAVPAGVAQERPGAVPPDLTLHRGRRDGAGAQVPRARSRRAALAVAASLLVGLVTGSLLTLAVVRDDDPPATAQTVVSRITLVDLELEPGAAGTATVVQTERGRSLILSVTDVSVPANSMVEVWLIDGTVTKMVPLGLLTGGQGEFALPEGLDLERYPIVDLSIEPLDGDPTHSGRSLLRGTIPA